MLGIILFYDKYFPEQANEVMEDTAASISNSSNMTGSIVRNIMLNRRSIIIFQLGIKFIKHKMIIILPNINFHNAFKSCHCNFFS